jgi:SAM-dependent methyltransferase
MREARRSYDAWHERVARAPALDTPWHRLVHDVLDRARDLDGRRVLEIACGRGDFAEWCVSHSTPALFVAADFSWGALSVARRRTGRVRLAQLDAQHIALASACADTVICCETLEHVPDPAAAVRELARVLKPGGRLYLTTPNYLGPMGAYRGYLRLRGRPYTEEGQPINHFLVAPLVRRWLRHADLRIVTATSAGHYLPFPGRPPVLLAERSRLFSSFGLHALTVAEKPL